MKNTFANGLILIILLSYVPQMSFWKGYYPTLWVQKAVLLFDTCVISTVTAEGATLVIMFPYEELELMWCLWQTTNKLTKFSNFWTLPIYKECKVVWAVAFCSVKNIWHCASLSHICESKGDGDGLPTDVCCGEIWIPKTNCVLSYF